MPLPPVLFDLDGTLVDSGPGITASVAAALAALGRPALSPARLRAFVGPPLQDSFAALGLDAAGCSAAVGHYRDHYRARGLTQCTVYDGIPALLAQLAAQGRLLAVATSKPEEFARRILEHVGLAGAFAVVSAATLDGQVRHKHQVVARALAALPDPRGAVLVGDRAQDVEGARRCGVPCLGAGWGYGEPGELEAARAAAVVGSPAGVPAALSARVGQKGRGSEHQVGT